MRTRRLAVVLAALLLALGAAPAAADNGAAVHIEIQTMFPDNGPSGGPFVASGPAVKAGEICRSGHTVDLAAQFRNLSPDVLGIRVLKHFECADGSGTFDVRLRVALDLTAGTTSGLWDVVSGTGDYDDLSARGTFRGIPAPFGILDVLDGHVD